MFRLYFKHTLPIPTPNQALSCSEALVRMQPPDVSQRVEQVQHQYVDLTNLLVRRIDDMHQQWKKDAARRAPSTKEQADVDKFGSVLLRYSITSLSLLMW